MNSGAVGQKVVAYPLTLLLFPMLAHQLAAFPSYDGQIRSGIFDRDDRLWLEEKGIASIQTSHTYEAPCH